MKSEFVHLHNHSDYSLLDGAQTVQTLVNTIDDLGMDSVALTEHGNMFSVLPYYKSAKKVFDANLNMVRIPFTIKELIKQILKFPLITFSVVFRIHMQAFKLWIKKAPFFIHPDKLKGISKT